MIFCEIPALIEVIMKKYFVIPMAIALSSCVTSISEDTIFRPNQDNRRDITESMVLDNEASLPDHVTLKHFRLDTDFGTVTATLANTGSNRIIVHCGGNAAERKTDGVNYLRGLIAFGDILIFDYPAYGDSEGEISTQHFKETNLTVATYVNDLNYEERAVWGQSLGGFICGDLSKSIEGLNDVVFETTATNANAVAKVWVPWYAKLFVKIKIEDGLAAYDNVNALEHFSGDILVLGAANDEQLSIQLSRDLAAELEKSGQDVTYIEFPDATHMTVPKQRDFGVKVNAFFGN